MKRTEIERKERDLKKMQKKLMRFSKDKNELEDEPANVGDYINLLYGLFLYDETEIYNLDENEEILGLLLKMKENFNDKEIENIVKKAIKKTKVANKEQSYQSIKSLID